MALINFTNLDFNQIKDTLKDYIQSNSEFTDYDFEGSNLSTILDVLAYNTYITSYNANMVSNEVFIDSATLRENVVALARNIVFTQPGEKFFQPEFGSRVTESLFDIADGVSALTIRDEIRSSIINYEPRVKLLDVTVIPNPGENEMNVTIEYEIVGLDISPQQLDFVLLPTR